MNAGPGVNANVTLNTNYDDAYMGSPQWDPCHHRAASRRSALEEPGLGGRVFLHCWLGEIHARAWHGTRRSCRQRYHLRDAILVDALSWYAIRNDWDPEHPASGYKNLVDGRYKVLEEFRKHGINVLSEQLRYPYIGKLALSVDGISGGDDPFGGQSIPLLPAVYRKSAIWGGGGASLKDVPRNLFWNSRSGPVVYQRNQLA